MLKFILLKIYPMYQYIVNTCLCINATISMWLFYEGIPTFPVNIISWFSNNEALALVPLAQ